MYKICVASCLLAGIALVAWALAEPGVQLLESFVGGLLIGLGIIGIEGETSKW